MENIEEKSRVEVLATRIELLFGFCKDLIPDIDLLEKAYEAANDRASFAMSAAPIFGAMGQDFEKVNFEWELKSKRAKAMVNLLKVLRDTENDRQKILIKDSENEKNMYAIKHFLGI